MSGQVDGADGPQGEAQTEPGDGPVALPYMGGVIGLALCSLGVLAMGGGAPAWWIGGGLLIAGLALLGPAGRELWLAAEARWPRLAGAGPWIVELASLGLIVAVATVMLGGALEARPVSGDHTVHFAKFLESQALFAETGRPLGWSHDLYAGHPLGYQYPFLPDLWLLAFKTAFGLGDEAAYGVGIWAFWVLLGVSVYAVGRRAFSRAVGLVAAVLYLTTSGLGHAGGWEYVIRWGVWPQWLAMALFLFGVSRLEAVILEKRRGAIAACGALIGLALLGHQATILAGLIGVVALALTWLWGPRPTGGWGGVLWRLTLVGLVALLVSAAFMWPFFDTRELTDERGNFWGTSYALGEALLTRASIIGELPIVSLAAIAGAALALSRRSGMLAVFSAFYAIVAIVGSHSSTLGELGLLEAADPFRHVIWYRVVELGKPFYFILAASALVALVRALRARGSAQSPPSPLSTRVRVVWAFAIGTALAPLAGGALTAFWVGELDRDTSVLFTLPHAEDREALAAHMRDPAKVPPVRPDGAGFSRVANLSVAADRYLSDLGPALGRPLYKPGFTPVSNYVYKIRAQTAAALTAINVGWAIADRQLPPIDWDPVASFGELRLFRFKHFDPRLYRVMAREPRSGELREVASATRVALTAFSREAMVLEVSDVPPQMPADAVLRVNVSAFPRWRATLDGRELAIETLPLEGHPGTGFLAVPLRAGRLELRFEPSTLDRVALVATPLGLLLAALIGLSTWPRLARLRAFRPLVRLVGWEPASAVPAWLAGRWPGPGARIRRVGPGFIAACAAALGVVALLLVLGAQRHPQELPERIARERVVESVLWDAGHALSEARARLGDQDCRFVLDRFLCKGAEPRFEVARTPAVFGEFEHATCVTLEPEGKRRASIVFPGVPPGDLSLLYGSRSVHRSLAPRTTFFRVYAGEVLVDEGALRSRPQLERRLIDPSTRANLYGPYELRVEVEANDDEARNACFSVQVVTTRARAEGDGAR